MQKIWLKEIKFRFFEKGLAEFEKALENNEKNLPERNEKALELKTQ